MTKMTALKIIILDEEFDEKLIKTRNKMVNHFSDGDYGPHEVWDKTQLLYFAINEFCKHMGFFDD